MLSKKLAIDNIPQMIKNKRVIMRVDFNVPVKNGKVTDPTRIQKTLPTIKYCLENGAKSIVLMSHMGRPAGSKNQAYSLQQIHSAVEDTLQQKVQFMNDCVGKEIEDACATADNGKIILLENLRFYMAEEGKGKKDGQKVKADPEDVKQFRQQLTKLGDLYVNDAFGTCHRAHSSMVGIDVPIRAAGFLVKKELQYFSKVLEAPDRPLTVVMGGAKVADKIKLIMNMIDLVDEMIIGGGMAFTFNKVLNGTAIGKSLFDEEGAQLVPEIMTKAKQKGVKIHIPTDFVQAETFDENAKHSITDESKGIMGDWLGLDIGPNTISKNADIIANSKTIFWNGPQGVFEMKPFAKGSLSMLDAIVKATQKGSTSVIGGGDTVALLKKVEGSADKLSHVSTGGGASLELVEGKELPGIKALSDIDAAK